MLGPDELLAADNFDPVNVVYLSDLNGDGDAEDEGEAYVWFEGHLPGGLMLNLPTALAEDPFGATYVLDSPYNEPANPDAIYRLEDLNADGDVNDPNEVEFWIELSPPGESVINTYDLDFDAAGRAYFVDSQPPQPWVIWRVDPDVMELEEYVNDDEVFGELGYHLAVGTWGTMTYNPYTDEMLTGGYYGLSTAVLLAMRDDNGSGHIEPSAEMPLLWDQASGTHTNVVDQPRDLYFLSDGSLLWVDMLFDQVLRLIDVDEDGDYDDRGETHIIYKAEWAQAAGQPVADRPQTVVGIVLRGPGDLNGDGCVGQSDLGILLADWGCTGGHCTGDCDGDTDQADLGILLAHWGEGCL